MGAFSPDETAEVLEREAQRHELAAARFRELGEYDRAQREMNRAADYRALLVA